MPTDEELTAVLSRVLDGAAAGAPEPVHGRLAAGARRAGLRRRGRRRAVLAGAVAAVLVAGAAGLAAFGGRPSPGPAAAGPRISDERFAELVGSLLPPGTVSGLVPAGPKPDPHEIGVALTFDDGAGASIVTVKVQYSGVPVEAITCLDAFDTPTGSCDRVLRPDGSVLIVDKLRSQHVDNGQEWRGVWAAPDGRLVTVIEFNGEPSRPNRQQPPLADTALGAMASSPLWAEVFAALTPVPVPAPTAPTAPETGGTGPAPSPAVSADALLDRLTDLLPAGTETGARNTAHTALAVAAAGRRSSLTVAYEPPSARGLADLADLPGTPRTELEVREPLPGGGFVVSTAFGDGKSATYPLLHWVVTVYYPDGARLVLGEWNGERSYEAAPGDPALDLAALKAIALSPAWRS
ncbi:MULTISPECIES: hypothetical protein [Kitasatospora]|uniref:Uncharacterized protein n=1 Tax=Kitasatospora setae (strain ATCC 33774 / DSM 43861 / JCM 3304 / KCC A-0304 / NBRC 14216 / KM-6054) TaxID=452652 RepID=E4N6N9_KITSK|nr:MULTISPECIES: hypothetical protein [Kitasatospora]BAJ26870.1 hypothetical protein KSE_10350 [Kitasatospora setae KM-6054]